MQPTNTISEDILTMGGISVPRDGGPWIPSKKDLNTAEGVIGSGPTPVNRLFWILQLDLATMCVGPVVGYVTAAFGAAAFLDPARAPSANPGDRN